MAQLEQGAVMRRFDGWQLLAGLSGFVGVVMGAVGAHAVSDTTLAALVERASLYQLLHSLLLLWLAGQAAKLGKVAVTFGILLFCGSLYGKALFGAPTVLAPAGGILLMAGWLCAAFAAPTPQSGAFKA